MDLPTSGRGAQIEMLDVTTNKLDDRTVVSVSGEIDVSGVSFIDSSGLRTLVLAQQHLGERKLIVRGPDATFKRLLGITGLDEVFEITD